MTCMKLKKLEEILQGVDGFERSKILLEQYQTPPHIASNMLFTIQSTYGDIEGKMVGDLGCGCGMLSIGSQVLGAAFTVGFEIDPDAIEIFQRNTTDMDIYSIDCVQTDVLSLRDSKWKNSFDTIIMNPPFGTKNNRGMDMAFVETGIFLASKAVYSLHKTSTRQYIYKKLKDWKIKGKIVAELEYNIDDCYKFHKKSQVDVKVDLWRFYY